MVQNVLVIFSAVFTEVENSLIFIDIQKLIFHRYFANSVLLAPSMQYADFQVWLEILLRWVPSISKSFKIRHFSLDFVKPGTLTISYVQLSPLIVNDESVNHQ